MFFRPGSQSEFRFYRFIRSSVGLVRRYGLAGIDLDWEFSAMDSGTPQDAENMATLIEEFRDYMEPWVKKEKDEVSISCFIAFRVYAPITWRLSTGLTFGFLAEGSEEVHPDRHSFCNATNNFEELRCEAFGETFGLGECHGLRLPHGAERLSSNGA